MVERRTATRVTPPPPLDPSQSQVGVPPLGAPPQVEPRTGAATEPAATTPLRATEDVTVPDAPVADAAGGAEDVAAAPAERRVVQAPLKPSAWGDIKGVAPFFVEGARAKAGWTEWALVSEEDFDRAVADFRGITVG